MVTAVNEQSRMFHLTHPWPPDFHPCPTSLWVGTESGTVGAGVGPAQERALGRTAAGDMFEDDLPRQAVPFKCFRAER